MLSRKQINNMAGAQGPQGHEVEQTEVQRAVDMLREAANLIDSSLQSGRNRGTTRAENRPLLAETSNQNAVSPTNVTSTRDAALQNFRNLFAGYGPHESS